MFCLCCINNTKFVQLILINIVKIVTKFDFGRRSVPDTTGRAYSGLPDALAGFKGATSKGNGESIGEGRGERERGCITRIRDVGTCSTAVCNILG